MMYLISQMSASEIVFLFFFAVSTILLGIMMLYYSIRQFLNLFSIYSIPESQLSTRSGNNLNANITDLEKNLDQVVKSGLSKLQNDYVQRSELQIQELVSQMRNEYRQIEIASSGQNDTVLLEKVIVGQYRKIASILNIASRKIFHMTISNGIFQTLTHQYDTSIFRIVQNVPHTIYLRELDDGLIDSKINGFFVRFINSLHQALILLENSMNWLFVPISKEIDTDKIMVHVNCIQFRRIVGNRIDADLSENVRKDIQAFHIECKKLNQTFYEVKRMVRYNFDSAAAELEDDTDLKPAQSSIQTALGGVTRLNTQLEEILKKIRSSYEKLENQFISRQESVMSKIRIDCEFTFIVGNPLYRVLYQLDIWRKEIQKEGMNTFKSIIPRFKSAGIKWYHHLREARIKLGLKTESEGDLALLNEYADSKTAQKHVPTLYRRIFQYQSIGDDDLFVSRTKELSLLGQAGNRWKEEKPSSVAVYGLTGSGKTSLIECALERYLPDQKIYRIKFDHRIWSVAELIDRLSKIFDVPPISANENLNLWCQKVTQKIGRAVVFAEDTNVLFQRKVNGFQVFEKWLEILCYTRAHFFWIASFEETAWHYLELTHKVSKQFIFQIRCELLDRNSLETMIWSRHKLSGYQHAFIENEDMPNGIKRKLQKSKDKETQQQILKDHYFDELYDMTEGNIYTSMHYWMSSTKFIEERKIHIHEVKPLSTQQFEKLDFNQLYTLLLTMQHNSFSAQLHADVLNITKEKSTMMISELAERNLIVKMDNEYYQINRILAPNIIKALRDRNLVHS